MAYEECMRKILEELPERMKERERKLKLAKEKPVNVIVKCKSCGRSLELRGPPIAKSYFYVGRRLIKTGELPGIGKIVRCECGRLNRFDFDWDAYRWL